MTVAVYADSRRRRDRDDVEYSAPDAASGVPAPSDEHSPCEGRCCGARSGVSVEEEESTAERRQRSDGASALQEEGDSGAGTSAGEGTQLRGSGDGLLSDSRQDSLSAGAQQPLCAHAKGAPHPGTGGPGNLHCLVVCVELATTVELIANHSPLVAAASKAFTQGHSAVFPLHTTLKRHHNRLHAANAGLSGGSAHSGLLPAPEPIGRSPFSAFDGAAQEVSVMRDCTALPRDSVWFVAFVQAVPG